MSEQQSNKTGLRSSGQKEERARERYESVPPSNAKPGSFGSEIDEVESDQDLALKQSTMKKQNNSE